MRAFIFLISFGLGISIFLLGMRLMSSSLTGALGHRLHVWLARLTTTPLRSALVGMVGTGLVQSSSAIAASMVALVHSGVMRLPQAFGVILGANVGTTITAQIVAFDLKTIAFPVMVAGLFLSALRRHRSVGNALFGFGCLLFGLTQISAALLPWLDSPVVHHILANFTANKWQAVGAGIVLTALIQSSSAVTGIVISLAQLNALSLPAAVGIALGSNIGTVITTLISSIGTIRESKATAYADLIFNVLGVLVIIPVWDGFLHLVTLTSPSLARQVANAHTIFNLLTALVALPFIHYLVDIAWRWAGITLGKKKY